MTARYTVFGKQVLRDGADFAQAVSPDAAAAIALHMEGRLAGSLERDALALRLTSHAATFEQIAASLTNSLNGQLRATFVDAAIVMAEAAKELSDG